MPSTNADFLKCGSLCSEVSAIVLGFKKCINDCAGILDFGFKNNVRNGDLMPERKSLSLCKSLNINN